MKTRPSQPKLRPGTQPKLRPGKAVSWFGAGAGAASAGVAMAWGELVSGFVSDVPSLVVAAGEVLVDYTPGDLIAVSIEKIGANQKPALVAGIVVATLLGGALAGLFAVRHSHRLVLGLFAALGIVGGWAAARNPMSPTLGSWITGLLAAIVGIFALYAVLRAAGFAWPNFRTALAGTLAETPDIYATTPADTPQPAGTPTPQPTDTPQQTPALTRIPTPVGLTSRRGFLAYAGAGAATAALVAVGRQARASSATTAARAALDLPPTSPSTQLGESLTSQLQSLDTLDEIDRISHYITPNAAFYRIDTALSVPNVDPANWQLSFDGMVDNPYSLSLDDLYAMDLQDYAITLSCVSNQVGGNLVGNAIWTGVPLADLLDRAGVQSGADQIVGRSVDHWTAGFPAEVLRDGRNAILAIGMNGEPLPVRHGFPARLVVAGLYGYVSAVKWINQVTLTTWDGFDGYWVPRGWSKEGPMKTQSRIDVPKSRDALVAGTTVPVAGIAWAPTRGIERVEVRIDDGAWQQCRLSESLGDETWVQWVYDWTPTAGEHDISVRATDGAGQTQGSSPVSPRPNGAEGWHRIHLNVAEA